MGIPPVIGFFAKQMVLSAALDNGYLFMAFIAITSKLTYPEHIFFYRLDYEKNPSINDKGSIENETETVLQSSLIQSRYSFINQIMKKNLQLMFKISASPFHFCLNETSSSSSNKENSKKKKC